MSITFRAGVRQRFGTSCLLRHRLGRPDRALLVHYGRGRTSRLLHFPFSRMGLALGRSIRLAGSRVFQPAFFLQPIGRHLQPFRIDVRLGLRVLSRLGDQNIRRNTASNDA